MSAERNARPGPLVLAAALAFLAVKAAWVLLPLPALGQPRIGDDALYYLWKGRSNFLRHDTDSPALRDVAALYDLDDSPARKLRFDRNRVGYQTLGTKLSLHELAAGFLLDRGLGLKEAWAVMELMTAAFLAAGLAVLLPRLMAQGPAAVAILLLGPAFFPQMGLHFLNPSVLCLAVAMLLWGHLLASPSPLASLLAASVLTGLHTIGQYYALMSVVLAWALALTAEDWPTRRRRFLAGFAVAAGVVLVAVASRFLPQPLRIHIGALSAAGLVANLKAVPASLKYFLANGWGLVLLAAGGLAGSGLPVCRRWRTFAAVTLLFLSGSLLHYLEYPVELFDRVFALFGVLTASLAGTFLWAVGREGRLRTRLAVGGLLVAHLGFASMRFFQHVFWNLNSREEILDEAALERRLAELPDATTVLYGEFHVSMQASLLKGGARLGAVPWIMLEGSPAAAGVLADRKPAVGVTIPFRSLNNRAAFGFRRGLDTWGPRRLGFDLRATRSVTVRGERPGLWLRFANPGESFTVTQAGCGGFTVPPGDGWLEAPPCASEDAVLDLPDREAWLLGLQTSPPREGLNWPWGSGLVVNAQARKAAAGALEQTYTWAALFAEADAPGLARALADRRLRPLSDDSGLVFFLIQSPS